MKLTFCFSKLSLCRQKVMVRNEPPTTLIKSHSLYTRGGSISN
jgi:hypothetical protein